MFPYKNENEKSERDTHILEKRHSYFYYSDEEEEFNDILESIKETILYHFEQISEKRDSPDEIAKEIEQASHLVFNTNLGEFPIEEIGLIDLFSFAFEQQNGKIIISLLRFIINYLSSNDFNNEIFSPIITEFVFKLLEFENDEIVESSLELIIESIPYIKDFLNENAEIIFQVCSTKNIATKIIFLKEISKEKIIFPEMFRLISDVVSESINSTDNKALKDSLWVLIYANSKEIFTEQIISKIIEIYNTVQRVELIPIICKIIQMMCSFNICPNIDISKLFDLNFYQTENNSICAIFYALADFLVYSKASEFEIPPLPMLEDFVAHFLSNIENIQAKGAFARFLSELIINSPNEMCLRLVPMISDVVDMLSHVYEAGDAKLNDKILSAFDILLSIGIERNETEIISAVAETINSDLFDDDGDLSDKIESIRERLQ